MPDISEDFRMEELEEEDHAISKMGHCVDLAIDA
jgi:hypothetical protein